jgi:hypothetical protein
VTEYLAELSIKLGYKEREYMARWLALEVLMADELAQQDQELYDALSRFQDGQEKDVRQKYGLDPETRPQSEAMLLPMQRGTDGSQP